MTTTAETLASITRPADAKGPRQIDNAPGAPRRGCAVDGCYRQTLGMVICQEHWRFLPDRLSLALFRAFESTWPDLGNEYRYWLRECVDYLEKHTMDNHEKRIVGAY